MKKRNETRKMKADKLTILKGYKENVEKPVNGLEQLREIREETINRWKESGILDGLTGGVPENLAEMFQGQLSYIINESGTTKQ
jgi:hypothetical protein